MNWIHRLLERLPYVRRLREQLRKAATAPTYTQLQFELDKQKQLVDVLQQALDDCRQDAKALADELLAYRRLYPPPRPMPLQSWRCSCPRVHPFHLVACSVCSRTRPPANS